MDKSTLTRRQVALIRGINVGRAKRVAMADLRALVEGFGYGDVRTVLNSGNIVYRTSEAPARAASRIEAGMATRLRVSARVTALAAADMDRIVTDNSLCDLADNHSRLFVAVLMDPGDRTKLRPLATKKWGTEAFAIGRRAAYMWCPGGALKSPLAEALARALGDGVTTRNWGTIMKLHDLVQAA